MTTRTPRRIFYADFQGGGLLSRQRSSWTGAGLRPWLIQPGPLASIYRAAVSCQFTLAGNFILTSNLPGPGVNTLGTSFDYFRGMSDSLERLYLAVIAAKDLDPAVSRTARLFQRGPGQMAKKLAEEAIEVVIDAVNGKTEAVVRESADLLYNLTVLWASAGVRPEDVWDEMARRERLLGIAEKMPKSPVKVTKEIHKQMRKTSPPQVARRPIVALETRKRH